METSQTLLHDKELELTDLHLKASQSSHDLQAYTELVKQIKAEGSELESTIANLQDRVKQLLDTEKALKTALTVQQSLNQKLETQIQAERDSTF